MKKLVLYKRTLVPKGYVCKAMDRATVPNQSLSLKQILTKFIKREALPVGRQGVYETKFGDLEKIMNADFVEREEFFKRMDSWIKDHESRLKDKEEKDRAKLVEEEAKKLLAASAPVPVPVPAPA